MTIEGHWPVILVGCGGGALCELLHWWNLRTQTQLPAYASSPKYWVLTLLMVAAGGFVTWLYFGAKVDALLGVHVGLTAPLLLQKLVGSVPEPAGARGLVPATSLKSFMTW